MKKLTEYLLGQLLYEREFSELSWDDESIVLMALALIVNNQSDTPKPERCE